MGLFGFVKDVIMLPVDIALDATMITPASRVINDTNHETPFGTFDRLASMGKNIEETLD